jgi:hypothetical protein
MKFGNNRGNADVFENTEVAEKAVCKLMKRNGEICTDDRKGSEFTTEDTESAEKRENRASRCEGMELVREILRSAMLPSGCAFFIECAGKR